LQHLLIARTRAIEEGLPLVRAANAGISVITDGYGRVRARLDLGARGILDGPLPVGLPATPYTRFGDLFFFALLLTCVGVSQLPIIGKRT
jgi:apolipoprotein N-acyltransferase